MRKKKILFHSDPCFSKTGFGRNTREILEYLYKTKKYDIVMYGCGVAFDHPLMKSMPWKSYGTLPNNQQEMDRITKNNDASSAMVSYGAYNLDRVVKEEKPDIYIGVQDIWGIDYSISKSWFDKITSVLWTTLDSVPILPTAVEAAKRVSNFWVWSNFAEKELHKVGLTHVQTVHGALNTKKFFRLDEVSRQRLKEIHGIPHHAFIPGFVFRNQLRKSVPNLLEGYKAFKLANPKATTYLFLHTHWDEPKGWDIPRLIKQYGLKNEDILTTYICRACGNYSIAHYSGQEVPCKFCRNDKSCITTNTKIGVTEEQLNEIYNTLDCLVHPFTSGGQEIPIQEAKLCELITLVTNYACGEEMCSEGSFSIPLEWEKYTEISSQFIKASTKPSSIANGIDKVFKMSNADRAKAGKSAREWALKNFAIEKIGKELEEFIDSTPYVINEKDFEAENWKQVIFNNYGLPCESIDEEKSNLQRIKSILKEISGKNIRVHHFEKGENNKNPLAEIPNYKYNRDYVIALYKLILGAKVDSNDKGYKDWMKKLADGTPREIIEKYFRSEAEKSLSAKAQKFEDLLDDGKKEDRIILVMPGNIGDCILITSLIDSLSKQYPNEKLYVATNKENIQIFRPIKEIYKIIPYNKNMDNLLWLEGHGSHDGYFQIAFLPYISTQKIFTYQHNGSDNIAFEILNKE